MDLSKLPRLSKTEAPTGPSDGPVPIGQTASQPAPAGQPAVRRGAYCDQCGAALRAGARFCDGCGTPVAAAAAGAGGGSARPGAAPISYASARDDEDLTAGGGPEAWISIALGVLLMFLSPRIWQYLFSPGTFPSKYTFTDAANQPLAYSKTVYFWGDLSITGFALALVLEGACMIFSRRPLVVLVAFVMTVAATLANLIYLIATYSTYGLALLSAIAVIFGVFMAGYQWRLLMALVAAQRRKG